ncbi:adenosine kinase [Reichenbachiella carrageenanivorans]|uniref:Adenosine kinase n=1 Tax=Reichenbachiella carrageenanivorans TaxID=2979869 RepID=A0ABY6D2A4_9BACT|nr:adenosine kinase [Reichenbachiella carrageenanivorans]UXX80291.1 adenosine kinase [Reichenbachiella carrageenanivorans]
MKKYDVYGIGNALVDLVFEVDDKFLSDYQVEKGLMTLVEEDRQKELISAIDIDENMMKGGGSAANTVVAASQLGAKCYYSCKVSNDEFGQFYLKDLAANQVDTKLTPATAPEGITGKCLVMVTADAERTMNTFLGITSDFSVAEIDEEAIKASKYIYSEGYLVPSPSGRAAMLKGMEVARANGVKVALSFSDPSMVKFFRNEMAEVVGNGVDLLFCNEEEAMLYTEKDNLKEAREELKKIADRFVITLGKNGAMIFDGDTFIDIEPYQVDAIDTNGAGDMYAGAFMFGITNGHSYAEAGKIASLASSKVVSQFGPRLEPEQTKSVLTHLFDSN